MDFFFFFLGLGCVLCAIYYLKATAGSE